MQTQADRPNAHLPPPSTTVSTGPADNVPFAGDEVTHGDVVHVRTDLDDVTGEFVSGNQRRVQFPLCPVVPPVNVQIRTANARAHDTDQYLIGPDRWNRPLDHLKPRTWRRLDECSHESIVPRSARSRGQTPHDALWLTARNHPAPSCQGAAGLRLLSLRSAREGA